jgi:phage-related protein
VRQPPLRPLFWVGASKKDYEQRFPIRLRRIFGYHLYLVQAGEPLSNEKPLNEGALKGLGIRELAMDDENGTYRVVYTVKLRKGIYVLHAFKKKSTRGIATPQHEIELVRARYAMAVRIDDRSQPS